MDSPGGESGRYEEESAPHAKSKHFRSAHQQVLSGKQTSEKKKQKNSYSTTPILNHDLCVCGSIYLFINRMGTGFRMAAGNERRQDKKTTA